MLQVIYGPKGAGKTKRILDMANESINKTLGNVVYLDDDNQYMYDLKNTIRFIDAGEYSIVGPKMFTGFLYGITAQDFDIEYIFVDGFMQIVKHPIETLEDMFSSLAKFTDERGITLVISVSNQESNAPEFLKQYII